MISIDEIRSMQKSGIDAENAKRAAWREERRKRTEEKIPYFEGKIKEAAEHGRGYWYTDDANDADDIDWDFLKHYFENLGFFVSITSDEYCTLYFDVAWDEKEIERLCDDFSRYERWRKNYVAIAKNAGKKKGFFSKLFS